MSNTNNTSSGFFGFFKSSSNTENERLYTSLAVDTPTDELDFVSVNGHHRNNNHHASISTINNHKNLQKSGSDSQTQSIGNLVSQGKTQASMLMDSVGFNELWLVLMIFGKGRFLV